MSFEITKFSREPFVSAATLHPPPPKMVHISLPYMAKRKRTSVCREEDLQEAVRCVFWSAS